MEFRGLTRTLSEDIPQQQQQPVDAVEEQRIMEDAPVGHAAHEKVKWLEREKAYRFVLPSPLTGAFQVGLRQTNGKYGDAGRIARLCYVKAAETFSLQEVQALREELSEKSCGSKMVKKGRMPKKENLAEADQGDAAASPLERVSSLDLTSEPGGGGKPASKKPRLSKKDAAPIEPARSPEDKPSKRTSSSAAAKQSKKAGAEAEKAAGGEKTASRKGKAKKVESEAKKSKDGRERKRKPGKEDSKKEANAGAKKKASSSSSSSTSSSSDKSGSDSSAPAKRKAASGAIARVAKGSKSDSSSDSNNDDAVVVVQSKKPRSSLPGDASPGEVAGRVQNNSKRGASESKDGGRQLVIPTTTTKVDGSSDSDSSSDSPPPQAAAAVAKSSTPAKAVPFTRVAAKMLARAGLRCLCHFAEIGDCIAMSRPVMPR